VVAEHLVEPDLEARDAGPLALARLQLGDPALAGVRELMERIAVGVVAVADHAAPREETGGSSTSAAASPSASPGGGARVRAAPANGGLAAESPAARSGIRRRASRSAPRSRGVALAQAILAARRSRSGSPRSASRNEARGVPGSSHAATASWRVR